ncbi:MAG: hypothetical protein R6V85_12650 [Polyangia bacterium]
MRTTTIFAIALAAFVSLSCSETSNPSRVHGTLDCGACSSSFSFDGSLATGGSKFYGHCKKDKDDNFSFAVGTDDRAHADTSTDFYFYITGVQGPPHEKVYGANGQPLDDEALYTAFDEGFLKNVNEFNFSPDDADNPDLCNVELYAVPGEGELDPTQKSFQYYVRIFCGDLEVESINEQESLEFVEAEIWFDECG